MKLISEGSLYSLLYAAYTYASYRFPAERINEYLVVNEIVPPNIRQDSQLSDVWRDYQQVLSELGFMYSTKVTGGVIEPTPCGLHLLDNQSKFQEILTGQVLLYQYPNGGKREYASEQIANGVLIRPAVLVWRIINLIKKTGSIPYLTSIEIKDFLMHCCNHNDSEICADAIIHFRQTGDRITPNLLPNAGRNATDWITLLTNTLLFKSANNGNIKGVALSEYAINNFDEIDELMQSLEDERSFWNPIRMDDLIRRQWYSFYGALRLEVNLPIEDSESDDIDVETNRDEQEVGFGNIGDVELRTFDSTRLNFNHENRLLTGRTIESSYDANMVANRHRLHDTMVIYIANICSLKGAQVLDDPKSIDLFVRYHNTEYLIEVKTITGRNYVKRLRYAIGQLFHYDFMLNQELPNRRKVLAFPSIIPSVSGFLPFCNDHIDFDVLSLLPTNEGQIIHCDSNHTETQELFRLI
jgi:hypothetical protein